MIEKIAVISDIHGNYWALKEVLEQIHKEKISTIMNLGDSLYGPLLPLETAHLILGENMISISGNEDRLILEAITYPAKNETIKQNLQSLDPQSLQWLKNLLPTCIYKNIFLCHGMLQDDSAYFCEAVSVNGVELKPLDKLIEITNKISQDIILCGHSHVPRILTIPNGKTIINPGSVGLQAYDDDQPIFHKMETGNSYASFCILTINAAKIELIEQKYVYYNNQDAIEAASKNNRPDWAKWLEFGRA